MLTSKEIAHFVLVSCKYEVFGASSQACGMRISNRDNYIHHRFRHDIRSKIKVLIVYGFTSIYSVGVYLKSTHLYHLPLQIISIYMHSEQ
jgi:hypothetical protein